MCVYGGRERGLLQELANVMLEDAKSHSLLSKTGETGKPVV